MFSIPFTVKKSIIIDKNAEDVFNTVSNFETWRAWSPWLCQEVECPVEISKAPWEVGHAQKWNGNRIGSGEMELISLEPNKRINYKISFIKPWKSQSDVIFDFKEVDSGTEVTWNMNGTLPILMFFMKGMMSAWVGSDYNRGLSMLKDLLESGEVLSSSNIIGPKKQDGFHYLGRRTHCRIGEIADAMKADFEKLHEIVEQGKVPKVDFVFSLYRKFDFKTGEVDYTAGFGFYEDPKSTNQKLEKGFFVGHKTYQIDHTGSYKHIGNAFSTAFSAIRAEKIRQNKSLPMYEIYRNSPMDTAEKDLFTEIHLPIK